jgi:outer membrane protein
MRTLALFAALVAAPVSALAGTVAIVDFERAVTETTEGRDAQTRLDTMFRTRSAEIERMGSELEASLQDFEQRALILSESARADEERSILQKQATYQATVAQYEQEMQTTYLTLLQDLDEKMRRMTETIARERGYALVLDKAAVVYFGGDTVDMTAELVRRYNAQGATAPRPTTPAPAAPRPATPAPAPR